MAIYSFLWSFLPALLAKKTTEKEIFRSAEGEKRCLRKTWFNNGSYSFTVYRAARLRRAARYTEL